LCERSDSHGQGKYHSGRTREFESETNGKPSDAIMNGKETLKIMETCQIINREYVVTQYCNYFLITKLKENVVLHSLLGVEHGRE